MSCRSTRDASGHNSTRNQVTLMYAVFDLKLMEFSCTWEHQEGSGG